MTLFSRRPLTRTPGLTRSGKPCKKCPRSPSGDCGRCLGPTPLPDLLASLPDARERATASARFWVHERATSEALTTLSSQLSVLLGPDAAASATITRHTLREEAGVRFAQIELDCDFSPSLLPSALSHPLATRIALTASGVPGTLDSSFSATVYYRLLDDSTPRHQRRVREYLADALVLLADTAAAERSFFLTEPSEEEIDAYLGL